MDLYCYAIMERRHVSGSCAGREKFLLRFAIKENIARLAGKKDQDPKLGMIRTVLLELEV